ncbi:MULTISPECIES: PEP-CTERM sorting domain-containing protein [unclassified Duganella]|uniref:PEP-CTERM sorting domain-containing protein n=1 Tax=unclassified Duganella TaxID=2636909 RepID=UPI000873F6B3|nr:MULTISPECIES: PEP-CTERM sorting domain-containing protein [unclassified Duganella]OEZ52492.1 PEP-CTERM motif protein [Duganella sp. HH105]OEZ97840.1 PEP-CTERM motif protein [Duganella sp. HH101]
MLKKMIVSGLLAASATLAHAETAAPSRWEFSWTGFQLSSVFQFQPDVTHGGTFGGVDANHNGAIELGELTELKIDGFDYATCGGECGVKSFSYSQGGGLNFVAGKTERWGTPPGPDWAIYTVEYNTDFGIEYESAQQMHHDWEGAYFTSETVKTITQLTPVPEPESYAMLGAGLLLLAGVARSRKKAGR